MIPEKLRQKIKNKYCWLTVLVFLIILLSRFTFLAADLPSTHLEIEEKSGGYNARSKVLLNHWALYENWYQPMVYMPIQTLLSYWSFSFFGVGLAQFRLPMVFFSFAGLVFFYLFLLKQTNRFWALFGLLFYAFNFEMTIWNRSGLVENLYLFFIPLCLYLLSTDILKGKRLLFLVFLAALSVVAKLDGYPFYLAIISFLFFWSLKEKFMAKSIPSIIWGSLAALVVLLALLAFFDAFKYLLPMYRFYFEMFGKQASFLKGLLPTLDKLIALLLVIDAYLFLAFLISLAVLFLYRRRLNKIDWFMMVFLLLALITRLQVPYYFIYWKRLIYLFIPFVYVISRALFFLNSSLGEDRLQNNFSDLVGLSGYGVLVIFLYLKYFNHSIGRFYDFAGFTESFHYTKGSFIYLGLVVVLTFGALCCRRKKLLLSIILFFVLLSFIVSGLGVIKIFLPQNIKYSYQENEKYLKMIPEGEMIVSHEQGFRAFVYLGKNEFYFNHDGGPNPNPYREVLERKDLRYFILNMEESGSEQWGLPNRVRLQLIKQAYPHLKLLGVFFASHVPMAIYDKYGNQ